MQTKMKNEPRNQERINLQRLMDKEHEKIKKWCEYRKGEVKKE